MPTLGGENMVNQMANFLRGRRSSSYILLGLVFLVVIFPHNIAFARKYCDAKNPLVTKSYDKTCDKEFIFCVPGIGGIPHICPDNLVFNPKRENCDIANVCSPDKEIDRDCIGKPCGLHADPGCETYYICSGGNKIRKKCPEGTYFDTQDKDCQDPTEEEVICFDETISKNLDPTDIQEDNTYSLSDDDFCDPHDFRVSPGAPPDNGKNGPGILLEAPKVTDWGRWYEWVHCPKGMYSTGMSVWKRSVEDDRKKFDHGGVVSIGFKCEDPLEMKKQSPSATIIGQCAKDAPDDSWFGFLDCEEGAAVGYQLSQHPDQKEKDDTATDNVKMICSCGVELEKFKPYHLKKPAYNKVGNQKGDWTETKYCNKKQALCGFKTQMQDWVQTNIVKLEKEDMTGMNQMHVKCCDVPSPSICAAKETLMYIETCDNSEARSARPCVAKILVGVAYNMADYAHSISFYTSIGYRFEESIPLLKKSIENNVNCGKGDCDVNYQKLDEAKIYRVGDFMEGEVVVQPQVDGKVHQVVVHCGIFKIYTNTLLVKGKKKDGKEAATDSFVI